jgi:hypothetical protein
MEGLSVEDTPKPRVRYIATGVYHRHHHKQG